MTNPMRSHRHSGLHLAICAFSLGCTAEETMECGLIDSDGTITEGCLRYTASLEDLESDSAVQVEICNVCDQEAVYTAVLTGPSPSPPRRDTLSRLAEGDIWFSESVLVSRGSVGHTVANVPGTTFADEKESVEIGLSPGRAVYTTMVIDVISGGCWLDAECVADDLYQELLLYWPRSGELTGLSIVELDLLSRNGGSFIPALEKATHPPIIVPVPKHLRDELQLFEEAPPKSQGSQ